MGKVRAIVLVPKPSRYLIKKYGFDKALTILIARQKTFPEQLLTLMANSQARSYPVFEVTKKPAARLKKKKLKK